MKNRRVRFARKKPRLVIEMVSQGGKLMLENRSCCLRLQVQGGRQTCEVGELRGQGAGLLREVAGSSDMEPR